MTLLTSIKKLVFGFCLLGFIALPAQAGKISLGNGNGNGHSSVAVSSAVASSKAASSVAVSSAAASSKAVSSVAVSSAATSISSVSSLASTNECGDIHRVASLDSATSCTSQKIGHTVQDSDIDFIFGDTWKIAGELTSTGSSGLLSGTGTGWGLGTASGSWFINSNFWNTYNFAVISMHVGGGNNNYVDSFEWRIIDKDTSGLWNYNKLNGNAGGMSNLQLWGSGKPTVKVPEPSPFILMLLGLFSLGLFRRIVK